MKVNEVYGVSNQMIETYIERKEVDYLFLEGLQRRKHIIIYGASKQGKTSLTNKHLTENDYVKVNCSTGTSIIDIYKSILRQLNIEILDTKEENNNIGGDAAIGVKAKLKIPILGSFDTCGSFSGKKSTGHKNTYRTVEYNLALAQDISELLFSLKFSKRIILENFHYLQEDVQQQLAFDLRIFEDYNILFIILGIYSVLFINLSSLSFSLFMHSNSSFEIHFTSKISSLLNVIFSSTSSVVNVIITNVLFSKYEVIIGSIFFNLTLQPVSSKISLIAPSNTVSPSSK